MKRSVLFVDDDANLIMGLKRSLRPLVKDWDLFFAYSGEEALVILEQNSMDVIVTDMRMPGMGGVELLEVVSEKYPQAVRFILSGHTDQEATLKASRVAHQFIAKPCETTKLVQTIQRSLQLRQLQANPLLLQIITSIKKLPSLPSLYVMLVKEIENPEASAKSIARIISQDITMTAKILQLVNSAFYGLPGQVSNLQQAVSIIGINALKSLVLYQGVFSEYQRVRSSHLSIDALWAHSISVGNLARSLARASVPNAQVFDDSQVAGVMHDIGKLIQLSIPDFYPNLAEKIKQGKNPVEAEYALLGTSHAELGAYLLGIWGLPDTVVQAVAYHHAPMRQPDPGFSVLTAVHVSNVLVNSRQSLLADSAAVLPLDLQYLETVRLKEKVKPWTDLYLNLVNEGKI